MKRSLALILGFASLLLAGCLPEEGVMNAGSAPGVPRTGEAPGPPSAELPFGTVDQGIRSGIRDARQAVVRDPGTWGALWAEHVKGRVPEPPLPLVDFSREMVLAYFLGEKPTSGYAVEIREIALSAGRVLVHVAVTAPPPGAPVLQVLTQPFHIVRAPRSELPVEFIPVEADPGPKRRG